MASFWSALVLAGVIAFGVGLVVVAYPSRSLRALGVLTGVYLLLAGAALISRALFSQSGRHSGATAPLLGLAALSGGAVVILNPGGTLSTVTVVVGILLIVVGAVDITHGIVDVRGQGPILVRGLLLVAAGTVVESAPRMSGQTLAALIGALLCVQGAVHVWKGLMLRAHWHGPCA